MSLSAPRRARARSGSAARRAFAELLFGLLAAVLVCLLAVAASAQEPTTTPAPPPPPPPKKVEVVATADLAVEVEKAKTEIAAMEAALESDQTIRGIEARIPELEASAKDVLRASQQEIESEPSLVSLDEIALRLKSLQLELDSAQSKVRGRAESIGKDLENLRNRRDKWAATRENAVANDAPDAVLSLISDVEAAIAKAETSAKKLQGTIVEEQGRIAALTESVKTEAAKLNEVRGSLVGKIFQPDRPPIWESSFWKRIDSHEFYNNVRQEREREIQRAKDYGTKNRRRLIRHGTILVLLIVAMVAVRRRVRQSATADDALAKVQAIFDRPISLAFLLLLLTSNFTLPEFPTGLAQLVGVFLLVPAVLVLRRVLEPAAFPILNALLIFFAIDRVRQVLVLVPGVAQLVFTVEMLAVAGLLIWWRRSARLLRLDPEAAQKPVFRAISIGVRLGLIGALASVLCGISGYSVLSFLIGNNVLYAAYTAVVLHGGVKVIDGLVAFLLRVRPIRLSAAARHHRELLRSRVTWLVHAGASFWWVTLLLERVELRDEAWSLLVAIFSTTIDIGELSIRLGDIVSFGFVIWASFAISSFIRFVLEEDVYPRASLPKGAPYAVSRLIHYAILLFGFTLAVFALGVDTTRFALLAGAFGVGIGFGLQDIVNNFVSGLVLLTERPVEVGDTVAMNQVFGRVERIGIRSSTVRTWDGAEVIVPNAQLISQQVTNWTHSDTRRRIEIPVGVPYGTDPVRVLEILTETAKAGESILIDPEPYALFMRYGADALEFEVRAWTADFENFLSIKSQLLVALTAALTEAGISIPFPQRDLHIKTLPPELPFAPKTESSSDD